jgi:hypothetical protein
MNQDFYDLDLEYKPDFVESMKRIYAWYECEIIDRVPVRFTAHNQEYETVEDTENWKSLKDRWYDVEYQIKHFEASLDGPCLGETFPVYWPNVGPYFYAAMLGGEIEFGDVTSWVHPILHSQGDADKIKFDEDNESLAKLMELTDHSLERCENRYMVGYTDMHPSLDCLDALRGTTGLCMDMYDDPDRLHRMIENCYKPFVGIMDMMHRKLKAKKQLSVSWMNIPSFKTMHIPSCDLGSMISKPSFDEFSLPYIKREVKHFEHNIFHLDGKGVANHIDSILELDEINAIQWVQGVGNEKPIMQWLPLIKKIQNAGKGVIVDLELSELEEFISQMSPKGIYLCISESDRGMQKTILDRLLKWS